MELRKGDDEKEIRSKLYNMNDKEYEKFWKQRRTDIYSASSEKEEKETNIKKEKIYNDLIKPFNFDFFKSEWDREDYEIRAYKESIQINFKTKDLDINNKLNKLPKEYDGMKLVLKRANESSLKGSDGLIFVTIIYDLD